MKIKLGDLKKMLKEEYDFVRGVPEFALRQATKKYVEELRQQIRRYILMNKSGSTKEQHTVAVLSEDALDELEKELNDLVKDKLAQFIRQV